MNYYNYEKDIFYDDKGYLITDIRDICEWYLAGAKREQKFTFNARSNNCKIVYKTLLNYSKTGRMKYTPYSVCNFLIKVFIMKYLNKSQENGSLNSLHISIYTPKVVRHNDNDIAIYLNILDEEELIFDTIFTNSKYKYTVDRENYFRLKLGLQYYLLGIEKDYGYLVYTSFKSAVKTIRIDNVFTHEQCERIIDNYFMANKSKRKADIKDNELLYSEIIDNLSKYKLLS